MTRSEPLDPSLLGPQRPQQPRVRVEFDAGPAGALTVTLLVPLDARVAPEQAALEAFSPEGGVLDVQCSVEIDLAAERADFARAFAAAYRRDDPLAAALRADALEPLAPTAVRDLLAPFAAQGASVFQRLFQPDRYLNYNDADAPLVRGAVLSALRRPQIVSVLSDEPLFPWAFLFEDARFDPLAGPRTLDPLMFWGFRHQLQLEVEGTAPRPVLPATPAIVAAVCPETDATQSHRDPTHPLARFDVAGHPVTWVRNVFELREVLRHFDADCLYFYGHADHGRPPTPTTSWIKLRGSALSVAEIQRTRKGPFARNPVLVFLNGCNTAPLDAWNDASVIGYLCLRGDRRICCVGTAAEIPAAYATAFAREVWDALFRHESLGAAVLAARAALYRRYNNPLGLLYVLFGKAETRLGRATDGGPRDDQLHPPPHHGDDQ